MKVSNLAWEVIQGLKDVPEETWVAGLLLAEGSELPTKQSCTALTFFMG